MTYWYNSANEDETTILTELLTRSEIPVIHERVSKALKEKNEQGDPDQWTIYRIQITKL